MLQLLINSYLIVEAHFGMSGASSFYCLFSFPVQASLQILSAEAIDAAGDICRRLELGSKLSDAISSKEDAYALFDLFRDEQYLLLEGKQKFHVSRK